MFGGVCDLTHLKVRVAVLRTFPVGMVWGVGPTLAGRLAKVGVATAAGLRDLDPRRARQLGGVVLERIARELGGVACLELELVTPPRKGLAVTRSFGQPLGELARVVEAVAAHATRAGEKLQAQGLVAGRLAAFVHSTRTGMGGSTTARNPPDVDDQRHPRAGSGGGEVPGGGLARRLRLGEGGRATRGP